VADLNEQNLRGKYWSLTVQRTAQVRCREQSLLLTGKLRVNEIRLPKAYLSNRNARSMSNQFPEEQTQAWHGPLSGTVREQICFSELRRSISRGTRKQSIAAGPSIRICMWRLIEDASSLEVYKKNFNPALAINGDIWSVLTWRNRRTATVRRNKVAEQQLGQSISFWPALHVRGTLI